MKTTPHIDFNLEWAKRQTREQFIEHFTPEGKPVHAGIDYGAEWDKIHGVSNTEKPAKAAKK